MITVDFFTIVSSNARAWANWHDNIMRMRIGNACMLTSTVIARQYLTSQLDQHLYSQHNGIRAAGTR